MPNIFVDYDYDYYGYSEYRGGYNDSYYDEYYRSYDGEQFYDYTGSCQVKYLTNIWLFFLQEKNLWTKTKPPKKTHTWKMLTSDNYAQKLLKWQQK